MAASAACASPRTSLLAAAVLPVRKHTRTVPPATKALAFNAAANTSLRTRPVISAAHSKTDASHARTKAFAASASPASSCNPTPAFLASPHFPIALHALLIQPVLHANHPIFFKATYAQNALLSIHIVTLAQFLLAYLVIKDIFF